jgi:hypothetical protein
VTEQNTAQPEITEAVVTTPAEIQPKRAKQKTKTPRTASSAKKRKKTAVKTDEDKRLTKNAAVREWRAKNKDRFAAYMKAWRENKKKQKAAPKKRVSKKAGARE